MYTERVDDVATSCLLLN